MFGSVVLVIVDARVGQPQTFFVINTSILPLNTPCEITAILCYRAV